MRRNNGSYPQKTVSWELRATAFYADEKGNETLPTLVGMTVCEVPELRKATANMLARNGFTTAQEIASGYDDMSLARCFGNGLGRKRFLEIQRFLNAHPLVWRHHGTFNMKRSTNPKAARGS